MMLASLQLLTGKHSLINRLLMPVSKNSPIRKDIILECLYVPVADFSYYRDQFTKCSIDLPEETLVDIQEVYPSAAILICGYLNKAWMGNLN